MGSRLICESLKYANEHSSKIEKERQTLPVKNCTFNW